MIGTMIRRHTRLTLLLAVVVLAAASIPVVAYVVVPALVRSTLVEDLPTAPAAVGSGAPNPALTQTSPPTETTLAKGELVRITPVDFGSGTVRVLQVGADRFLRFEDVEIAGAPDMYVYLSDRTDGRPGTYVDLGKLKATNGSFNYAIPGSLDLSGVRSVVVWCRQFSVTVTYAVFM